MHQDQDSHVGVNAFRRQRPTVILNTPIIRLGHSHHSTGSKPNANGSCRSGAQGLTRHASLVPKRALANAGTFLMQHLLTPRQWMHEERLVVVRPRDLTRAAYKNGNLVTQNGVTLGDTAVVYLHDGFTLLLARGVN